MAFQHSAFQQDAFQTGGDIAAFGASYFDDLPNRIRVILYQSKFPCPREFVAAADTTVASSAIFDPPAVRKSFEAADFSTFTVPTAQFTEVEGFDDFDAQLMRRPRLPPQDITTSYPTVFVAVTPTTAGIQDIDYTFKRPFRPPQFTDFVTISGIRATTPFTAGLQDFDKTFRRPFVDRSFITYALPTFQTIDGVDPIFGPLFGKLRLSQQLAFVPSTQVVALTPVTAGVQDFNPLRYQGRWLISDFAGAESIPVDVPKVDAQFGPLFKKQLIDTLYITSVGTFTPATATPITAGVEPTFGPLFKKQHLQQQFALTPFNRDAVAATPITAGLQDLDLWFKKPFRPPQFADFVVNDTRAGTPITAGIQDFDRALIRRPLTLRDFSTSLISQIRVITAGIQGFEALLRRQRAPDPAQALVLVPAAAARAGTQGLDVPARQRRSLDQGQSFVVSSQATATPITAGLQNLDYRFLYPMRPALQQVTSWAPVVITLAVTPTPFQFAYAGLPPFRYGMRVKLQMFEARGQNVGIKLIVHRPAKGALLTPQLLLGTKDQPSLAGTDAQPDVEGEVED